VTDRPVADREPLSAADDGTIHEGSLTLGGNRIGPKAWRLIVALNESGDDWLGAVLDVVDEASDAARPADEGRLPVVTLAVILRREWHRDTGQFFWATDPEPNADTEHWSYRQAAAILGEVTFTTFAASSAVPVAGAEDVVNGGRCAAQAETVHGWVQCAKPPFHEDRHVWGDDNRVTPAEPFA
jgi:hypothetical protein